MKGSNEHHPTRADNGSHGQHGRPLRTQRPYGVPHRHRVREVRPSQSPPSNPWNSSGRRERAPVDLGELSGDSNTPPCSRAYVHTRESRVRPRKSRTHTHKSRNRVYTFPTRGKFYKKKWGNFILAHSHHRCQIFFTDTTYHFFSSVLCCLLSL